MSEELFDICLPDGTPTGRTIARPLAHKEGICHRTAHIWVIREKNAKVQILMQKRSGDKDSFPGCFDTSSAGHVKAGDEPLASALRELSEEIGIHADEKDLTFAGTFRIGYEKEFHGRMFRDNEVAFVYVYCGGVDADSLELQKEEVSAVKWFDLDDVYREKRSGNETFCVDIQSLILLKEYLKKIGHFQL